MQDVWVWVCVCEGGVEPNTSELSLGRVPPSRTTQQMPSSHSDRVQDNGESTKKNTARRRQGPASTNARGFTDDHPVVTKPPSSQRVSHRDSQGLAGTRNGGVLFASESSSIESSEGTVRNIRAGNRTIASANSATEKSKGVKVIVRVSLSSTRFWTCQWWCTMPSSVHAVRCMQLDGLGVGLSFGLGVSHSGLPTERALTSLLCRPSSQEGIGGGHVVSIRSQASDEVGMDQIFSGG